MPLGGLLGGTLGALVGVRLAVLVCVLGRALAFLPVFLSPLRTLRELPTLSDHPDDTDGPQTGPDPALAN